MSYIGSYGTLEQCKQEFLLILKGTRRNGMDRLLDYMQKDTDFFTAPYVSSHLPSPIVQIGGLLRHTLNVYSRLLLEYSHENQLQVGGDHGSEAEKIKQICDTLAVVGLLHPLYQANRYSIVTKSELSSETGAFTEAEVLQRRDDIFGYGRGDESVYKLSGFIRLNREEAFAIRFQDGDFGDENNRRAYCNNKLALMLYTAILKAEFIDDQIKLKV